MDEPPILIAGGGPVGMTLALVLARLGVRCILAERNLETTRHPKMDITNVRSMELFRRYGLAQALRAVAVPEANNFDVAWVTTMAGHELHRFRYPSAAEKRALIAASNDGSQPLGTGHAGQPGHDRARAQDRRAGRAFDRCAVWMGLRGLRAGCRRRHGRPCGRRRRAGPIPCAAPISPAATAAPAACALAPASNSTDRRRSRNAT